MKPVRCAVNMVMYDSRPANKRLNIAPITADVLFALKPPTRYIVAAVEAIQIKIVARTGFIPINIKGESACVIRSTVSPIEIRL